MKILLWDLRGCFWTVPAPHQAHSWAAPESARGRRGSEGWSAARRECSSPHTDIREMSQENRSTGPDALLWWICRVQSEWRTDTGLGRSCSCAGPPLKREGMQVGSRSLEGREGAAGPALSLEMGTLPGWRALVVGSAPIWKHLLGSELSSAASERGLVCTWGQTCSSLLAYGQREPLKKETGRKIKR